MPSESTKYSVALLLLYSCTSVIGAANTEEDIKATAAAKPANNFPKLYVMLKFSRTFKLHKAMPALLTFNLKYMRSGLVNCRNTSFRPLYAAVFSKKKANFKLSQTIVFKQKNNQPISGENEM